MGHRPGDKDVLAPDDEGRSLLAVIRTFTRLIEGDWSAQRAAWCLRSANSMLRVSLSSSTQAAAIMPSSSIWTEGPTTPFT